MAGRVPLPTVRHPGRLEAERRPLGVCGLRRQALVTAGRSFIALGRRSGGGVRLRGR
jgi:hypothetical protein